jgi:hypothetical protein
MTREEVVGLVQGFLKKYEIDSSPGLNKNDIGGVLVGEAQLYFEYDATSQSLACNALVYKFRKTPSSKILAALKEQEESFDTGGGKVTFQTENQCAFLTRSYTKLVSKEEFLEDMQKLMAASIIWHSQAMDKAFTIAQG